MGLYIEDFLEHCVLDRNLAPGTVKMYRYYLETFLGWLDSQGKLSLTPGNLGLDLIRGYRLYLSGHVNPIKGPLKRSTQTYFIVALRALLRYLSKKGVKGPASDQIELGRLNDRQIKFLTSQELTRVLGAPDITTDIGLRDKALLEVLFSTGLRVSELVRLNRDEINLNTREFGVLGKGGKVRLVFLSKRACMYLEKYIRNRADTYKAVFIRFRGKMSQSHQEDDMRLTVRSVERIVEGYGKKCRLRFRIGPHVLRHSFATDLLSHGADLRSVQELLGHSNVGTTQIYTHVTNPQLRQVHEEFHSGNTDE